MKAERAGPGRVRLSPAGSAGGLAAGTVRRTRGDGRHGRGAAPPAGGDRGRPTPRSTCPRSASPSCACGPAPARHGVTLPAAAGFTRVDAEGGAAAIRFRVPDGVAARIRSSIALGSSDVDAVRFPRNAAGSGWESPDFETAANRVEIEVRGGSGASPSADRGCPCGAADGLRPRRRPFAHAATSTP